MICNQPDEAVADVILRLNFEVIRNEWGACIVEHSEGTTLHAACACDALNYLRLHHPEFDL